MSICVVEEGTKLSVYVNVVDVVVSVVVKSVEISYEYPFVRKAVNVGLVYAVSSIVTSWS